MINIYRRFISKVAELQQWLNEFLKEKADTPIAWDTKTEEAYKNLKTKHTNATMLTYPVTGEAFSLTVDASDNAIGATLQQLVEDSWQPLAFYTKTFISTKEV